MIVPIQHLNVYGRSAGNAPLSQRSTDTECRHRRAIMTRIEVIGALVMVLD
jgi:hypothetical protein